MLENLELARLHLFRAGYCVSTAAEQVAIGRCSESAYMLTVAR
jgi:hypothetical protein